MNLETVNKTGIVPEAASLVFVKQLPIIEENLKAAAESIRQRTEEACSLACTPETVKDVKALRAELNREFGEFEQARKAVKEAVSAPYLAFEAVYKECISTAYKSADTKLKEMIENVEYHARLQKEQALRIYFAEHVAAAGLDRAAFSFERSGISVLLSKSDRSLKSECKRWIDERRADMDAIEVMEGADEIAAEYKRCLNLGAALAAVNERKAQTERERLAREAREADKAAKAAAVAAEKAQGLAAPVPVKNEAEEKVLELHFKVWGTREKLRALKAFLDEGGYRYD